MASANEHGTDSISSKSTEFQNMATWYRLFARKIDLFILGIPTTGLALAVPLSMGVIRPGNTANLAALIALSAGFPIIEAAVSSRFGNTPGKALFGLKVKTVEGVPLKFRETLMRAYRVTAYGFAFYLPFVSLVTLYAQFISIRRNGYAGYDAGRFRVDESPLSPLRSTIAVSVFLILFSALIALSRP